MANQIPPTGIAVSPPKEGPQHSENHSLKSTFKAGCAVVKKVWDLLRYILSSTKRAFGYLPERLRGLSAEEPKTIVYRGRQRAWKTLLIHFTPLVASSVIIAMNMKGFYIGSTLSGQTDATSQSFYLLCLQITTKILVSAYLKLRDYLVDMRQRLIQWKGTSSCSIFRPDCS